ncbi:phosphoribosylaminoimidazolesuccinocarboxamide synthase [Flavobacterium sp. '19STA2R22 D10 B1']|uniref:phosphoribosylaminoimidazolesuccinocarboxamide synthase n=1 Tax=Flavobacterium aerium TaxID=3037261 RepID=UPI00278C715E|nr:phosphoribosylaminoimidazolesuccinocarboxamide synthase [Flavobacterium sp. '19STA2R22 D10 B1']
MENQKTFRTRTGFCHIFPDKIVLTRKQEIDDLSKIKTGTTIYSTLVIYGFIVLWLLYSAYINYQEGKSVILFLKLLVAVFLIYSIVRSFNNSTTPIIERKKVKSVKFHDAKPGLTRAYFEVFFEDEKRNVKKRLILLPGSLSKGDVETKKAVKIMREEKLYPKG